MAKAALSGRAEDRADETKDGPEGQPRASAERASAIAARLGSGAASPEEVFAAFEELDALPPDVVREALAEWTGPAPDLERLDAATRRAHGLPPPPLRLRTDAVVKDADVLDLGPLAEEQLRIGGANYDGLDLEPEERLDGEREDSFAGTLEHRTLSDEATGERRFDVLLFAGDSGVVFRAGTTEQVGSIAYDTVEMADRRARAALQEALASVPEPAAELGSEPRVAEEAAPAARPSRAKASATKRAAKPAGAGNKAEAKRSAIKEASAPKKARATQKSAPVEGTEASATTTAAKKTAAKKASAEKTPAKKTAATKAAGKKASAKKTSATEAATTKASTAKKASATKRTATTKAPAAKAPAKKSSAAQAPAKKARAKN